MKNNYKSDKQLAIMALFFVFYFNFGIKKGCFFKFFLMRLLIFQMCRLERRLYDYTV